MRPVYKIRRISDGLYFTSHSQYGNAVRYNENGRTFNNVTAVKLHIKHIPYAGPHEIVTFAYQEQAATPLEDYR